MTISFVGIDNRHILDRLAELPITLWEYRGSDNGWHIGPVAEDFYAAFGLGNNDRYISGTDARGVSMAAIKGLYELVKEQEKVTERLSRDVARLKEAVAD